MKIKHLFLTLLAVATVAAVSCKKEDTGKASLEISPAELSFEATASTQSVSVTSNRDWKIESESSLPSWIKVTKVSASEATVSVEANTGNDRSQDVVFRVVGVKRTLSVSQKGEKGAAQEGDGTEANPYTASQALAETSKLEQGKTATTESYYVTGQIVKIKEVSTKYGNATFYISDDGTATNQYTIYQCYYAGGVKFTDETKDAIKVGDLVVVKGPFVNYYDSNHPEYGATPEMKGGQIVSINGKVPEGSETPDYTKAEAKTVAEFIAAANKTTYYKLTGTVSNFNSTYCSFDLEDASGSIYVYSVNNKSDWSSKLANDGTVTLAGLYDYYENEKDASKNKPEVISAYILSYEAAEVKTTTVTGLAVAVSSVGFLLKTDATENNGIVYVYDTKVEHTVKVGDNVTVEGTETTYNDVPEITGYTFKVNTSGNTVTYPTATEITKDNISTYDNLFGYVKTTGQLSISGTYYNIVIDGATYKGSLSNPASTMVPSTLNNKNVDVAGYFLGVSGSNTKYFNILVTSVAESAVQPDPVADPEIKDGKLTLVIDDVRAKFAAATVDGKDGYTATISGFAFELGKAASTSDLVAPTDLLKVYKNSTLAISSSAKKIKSVELTCSESKYCKEITVTSDNNTVVKPTTTAPYTLTWTGSTAVNTFKFTATGGQCRITKIVITVA